MYDLAFSQVPPASDYIFSSVRSAAHVTRTEVTSMFRDLLDHSGDILRPVDIDVHSSAPRDLGLLARRRRVAALAARRQGPGSGAGSCTRPRALDLCAAAASAAR